jgi:hypothetical protein
MNRYFGLAGAEPLEPAGARPAAAFGPPVSAAAGVGRRRSGVLGIFSIN